MRPANNVQLSHKPTRKRARPRRQYAGSVSPDKDQDGGRRDSQSEESDSMTGLDNNNHFALLCPAEPVPGTVPRTSPNQLQSGFTFRVESHIGTNNRSRAPFQRQASTDIGAEKTQPELPQSSHSPKHISRNRTPPSSDTNPGGVSLQAKSDPSRSKSAPKPSSIQTPSLLFLEEKTVRTTLSPTSSSSKKCYKSTIPSTSETSPIPDSKKSTPVLHPSLPSPAPMTTAPPSPTKPRHLAVEMPPTPARTRTPSPDDTPVSTSASGSTSAKGKDKRRILLVVIGLGGSKKAGKDKEVRTESTVKDDKISERRGSSNVNSSGLEVAKQEGDVNIDMAKEKGVGGEGKELSEDEEDEWEFVG